MTELQEIRAKALETATRMWTFIPENARAKMLMDLQLKGINPENVVIDTANRFVKFILGDT